MSLSQRGVQGPERMPSPFATEKQSCGFQRGDTVYQSSADGAALPGRRGREGQLSEKV